MIHRFVFPKGRIILVDWIILFLFFEQKRRRNEEEVFIEAKNLSRKTKEIMIDDRNNRVSLFIESFHAASTLLGWFDMNVKKNDFDRNEYFELLNSTLERRNRFSIVPTNYIGRAERKDSRIRGP